MPTAAKRQYRRTAPGFASFGGDKSEVRLEADSSAAANIKDSKNAIGTLAFTSRESPNPERNAWIRGSETGFHRKPLLGQCAPHWTKHCRCSPRASACAFRARVIEPTVALKILGRIRPYHWLRPKSEPEIIDDFRRPLLRVGFGSAATMQTYSARPGDPLNIRPSE